MTAQGPALPHAAPPAAVPSRRSWIVDMSCTDVGTLETVVPLILSRA